MPDNLATEPGTAVVARTHRLTKRRRTAWHRKHKDASRGMSWVLSAQDNAQWRRAMLPEQEHHIPSEPGCYVVYLNGFLAYVGSTRNLQRRMLNYGIRLSRKTGLSKTPWGEASLVTIKYKTSLKYGDWLMLEARLIRRLRPRGNRVGLQV